MSRPAPRMRFTNRKHTTSPLAMGVSVLVALTCAACGSSPAPNSSAAPPSSSRSTATNTTSTATNGGTATNGATGTGTGATSTTALPGTGKPPVTIGDKNYTEQFLLGELYRLALQAQGYTVDLNQNIGPTDVTLQALKVGTLAMYPEYLNIFNSAIAGDSRSYADESAAYAAAQRYALAHGLQLLAPTPFSDTDAIAVTVGYAQANHLSSLDDLAKVAGSLTVGGPPQFEQTTPGLPSLELVYGFKPAGFKALAVGDQYTELNAGTVQAADVGTTDGQLTSGDYRLLSDPHKVFGWGNVVPVLANSVAATEGPAFVDTVQRISALLSTSVMRQLNAAVDVAGQDPTAVATQFLETHDLIPPASS